jgi:Right handed beta helix region
MKTFSGGALIALGLLATALLLGGRNQAASLTPAKTNGANFVVSSGADAGPGSLRDAILAADRLSESAHILVEAKHIGIESPLPPLINTHGIVIEAAANAGVIDAAHVAKGAALQINGPASIVRGLTIMNARDLALFDNAPGLEITNVSISASKTGIALGALAKGGNIRTSVFERNETGISADGAVRDIVIASCIFRGNTRAGFWFVGAGEHDETPLVRITDGVFEKNASGVVLANRPTLIQKSRFLGNAQSAVLVLGGAARIEDSEIRNSGGTAISVTSGQHVALLHNTLTDNPGTAIMVHDSQASIERNTLTSNGSGIVAILSQDSSSAIIKDNIVSKSAGDAITIIGGSPSVQHNQLTENHSAGVRVLDLVYAKGSVKATPHLDANVLKGNGIDMPPTGVYKSAGPPAS